MSPNRQFAVGLLGVCFGGAAAYLLFPDVLLAATSAVLWGVGAALTVAEGRVWNRRSAGASLVDALPAVALLLVGVFGVHAGLPIDGGLRMAVVVLASGAVLAATNAGIRLGRRSSTE